MYGELMHGRGNLQDMLLYPVLLAALLREIRKRLDEIVACADV